MAELSSNCRVLEESWEVVGTSFQRFDHFHFTFECLAPALHTVGQVESQVG